MATISLQRFSLMTLRLVAIFVLIALAAGPSFLTVVQLRFAIEVFLMLVLAMMWNLLAGYADIVTVGQHAFVGIGAYALFGFAVKMHVNVPLSIFAAGTFSFLCSIPIMIIVFRLRASYLAIGTWVVANVCTLIATKLPGFGGATGLGLPPAIVQAVGQTIKSRFEHLYWLSFSLVMIAFAATAFLLRSRFGVGLMAMRDNEEAAGSVGVNLTGARIVCFLWAGLFLGLAGALLTLQSLMIEPDASFSLIDYTVYVIFAVVIGGIGSMEGSIIGVLIYVALRSWFSAYGNLYLIFLGVISIIVMLAEPRGIWGVIRRVLPEDVILVSHRYRAKAAK